MDIICADKYTSRWYVQGGHWINLGLQMFVAMDRKPENETDIKNAASGQYRIMMRLRNVKSARNEADQEDDEDNTPCGTKVLE